MLAPDADDRDHLPLVAYCIDSHSGMELITAPATRAWMHATARGFAYRCLPMQMANQAGWLILNNQDFWVTWSGDPEPESLQIEYLGDHQYSYWATSLFGYGIVTFNIPWLFRTPKGYNLLARGPANVPKDGIQALEGLIETDWVSTSFTMNWMLTRPGSIAFEAGEPICQLVPQERGLLERFRPGTCDLADNPELYEQFYTWSRSRDRFMAEARIPDSDAARQEWQKDYFIGRALDGTQTDEHQRRLALRPFAEADQEQA